ncbi:Transcription termination factor MTEF1, chloroplastic [Linum grandiflorum]
MLINGGPIQLFASLPLHRNQIPICAANSETLATATPPPDAGILFRKKLIYLSDLRIDVRKALTVNPNIRSTPIAAIHSVESCLSSMGLNRRAIGRILDMYPAILTFDSYVDIYPVFDFLLNEVGIEYREIPKSISRCPRLLVCGVESQLRPAFEFLKSVGFYGKQGLTPQTTLLLVYNVENTLKRKMAWLKGLGFEDHEVANMVVRTPGLFTFSVEKNLVPKFEYFVKEMKGDLEELKCFPQYFCYSLEEKIKPRHRMLAWFGIRLPVSKMLRVSDGEFDARLSEIRLGDIKEVLDAWT